MEDTELKIGGFTFKGWYIAAALPILSGLSGAIYYGYDTVQRFYAVEEGIADVVARSEAFDEAAAALNSRIQALEQAVQDNDVRGLNGRLAQISTQMQTILEQQAVLLNLRSQVERSTTITDGLGDILETLQTEIDDIWDAYDYLVENPL
jgi:small-conductance mechanosensitive channel